MNRYEEDELEKEIADKYIENMDAPELWDRIVPGLDAVDAKRAQRAENNDEFEYLRERYKNAPPVDMSIYEEENKQRKRRRWRFALITSGYVVAAVASTLIINWKIGQSNDSTRRRSTVMIASDANTEGSYMEEESDAVSADESESYDVQSSQGDQEDAANHDYAPMIMVDGVLYKDTYDMVDTDSVDESNVFYAESYTDGTPANDGEVNFDRNPSKNSAYVVCDDGSLIVKVEGNWYRFERAE